VGGEQAGGEAQRRGEGGKQEVRKEGEGDEERAWSCASS